jgi:hypothetical protein
MQFLSLNKIGIKFGPNQASAWLVSSISSLGIDILLQQPLVIMLLSIKLPGFLAKVTNVIENYT